MKTDLTYIPKPFFAMPVTALNLKSDEFKAFASLISDYQFENKNLTVIGYASQWGWNRMAASRFITKAGFKMVYPKTTDITRKQRGWLELTGEGLMKSEHKTLSDSSEIDDSVSMKGEKCASSVHETLKDIENLDNSVSMKCAHLKELDKEAPKDLEDTTDFQDEWNAISFGLAREKGKLETVGFEKEKRKEKKEFLFPSLGFPSDAGEGLRAGQEEKQDKDHSPLTEQKEEDFEWDLIKDAFFELYAMWPSTKAGSKTTVKKIFVKLIREGELVDWDQITTAAEMYLDGRDPEFTHKLENWLTQGQYEAWLGQIATEKCSMFINTLGNLLNAKVITEREYDKLKETLTKASRESFDFLYDTWLKVLMELDGKPEFQAYEKREALKKAEKKKRRKEFKLQQEARTPEEIAEDQVKLDIMFNKCK